MSSLQAPARIAGITLGEMLPLSARRDPDKECFLFPDGSSHSFALTNQRVNQLVWALRSEGVRAGDRIAIFALDSHRYIETVLACMKMGVAYVPLNYRLQRAEVDVLIARSQPVALFYDVRYESLLAGIEEQNHGLRLMVELDGTDGRPSTYEALLATAHGDEPPVVCTDDDVIALAFTSGTTGLPKCVVQPQRMLKNINYVGGLEYLARRDDVRYTAAPTFHISGICGLFLGVSYGFTSVLLPQFDAEAVLQLMVEDKISATFLVPTMISSILQCEGVNDHAYGRLRLITYGAAPISPALLRRAMGTFDCDFLQAFGAGTEAGLQAVLGPAEHRRALSGKPELLKSCGKPSFAVAMRIVDEDMNEVATGEVGEVATRSDQVMDGYLERPEDNARAFRDGWFRAGDMGYFDDEGYLYLHGRNKDMIIRGGENVYPIEIETVLAEHEAVAQSAVVGVPDVHWGETVRAFVTLRPGADVDQAELRRHCNARLARYKVPQEFIQIDELPTNASGKVLKRELRSWNSAGDRISSKNDIDISVESADTSYMTSAQDGAVALVTPEAAVQLSIRGHVGTLTIHNPKRKNSIDDDGWELLREKLDEVERSAARILVITGSGQDFCAGADLSGPPTDRHPLTNMAIVNAACKALHRLPIPVVARVDGAAVGAGMNLALACDFIIATDRVRFSEIFVKRGLSVDFGGSWILPRIVGLHRAKELVLLGDFLSAEQGKDLGFVYRVVRPEELDGAVEELTQRIVAGPPMAIQQSKRLLNDSFESPLELALENEARAQAVNLKLEDAVEAAAAFFEKRDPVFLGK